MKYKVGAKIDVGLKRKTNEDEIVICNDINFFAVIDGMGGLINGGNTSKFIKQVLGDVVRETLTKATKRTSIKAISKLLKNQIASISDAIYTKGNSENFTQFGAALSAVFIKNGYAIFINLGDCRGYILPKHSRKMNQVTNDQNLAAVLVEMGELTKEQAKNHSSASTLLKFAGMKAPATPEVFIQKINNGDRILLCSDGLHGMTDDNVLPKLLRTSKSANSVCSKLIKEANNNGGKDNISAIYIKIINTI